MFECNYKITLNKLNQRIKNSKLGTLLVSFKIKDIIILRIVFNYFILICFFKLYWQHKKR